jgi:signal transduction histidine kinase
MVDLSRIVGWRPTTVRAKLTLVATGVVAGVLVASGVGLVVAQQRMLVDTIDDALVERADDVTRIVAGGNFGARLPAESDPDDSFVQVIGPGGAVLAASPNAANTPAVVGPNPPGAPQRIRTVRGIALSDEDFRVLSRPIQTRNGLRTLVVGQNLDDVTDSVEALVYSLLVTIPLVTLLLALVVRWLTGRVLAPVESIRVAVAGIRGADLDRRVPTPQSRDEIARLARTMNDMLARVQDATERQRRFVADASHELRSPLTRLRSSLEMAIAHPDGEPDAVLHHLWEDTVSLQRLVDDLLLLARSEAGAQQRVRTPVDLDDLVLAEAKHLRERARVDVDASRVSAARTVGDPQQLARVVANLTSNAERHAASRVTFELREVGNAAKLVVADDGPGIPPEHRKTVFTRFTRLDEARSRGAGGFGLGLAIVADIVARHDGKVSVVSHDGAGARFEVTLPRAP